MMKKEMKSVTINDITITEADMESAYRTLDMDISMVSGFWNTDTGSMYRLGQILDAELPEPVKVCILSLLHTNMYIDSYVGIEAKTWDHDIDSDAWKNLEHVVECMENKNLPIDVYDEDDEEWRTVNIYDYSTMFVE